MFVIFRESTMRVWLTIRRGKWICPLIRCVTEQLEIYGSAKSTPAVFYKKGVLKNFAKITVKLRPEAGNFIKVETPKQVFSFEF